MDNRTAQRNKNLMFRTRPAMIHFSTIQYVSRYSCHDTIHDTIRYITTKQEGYCLVSCSWAQKSVQLTSLVLNAKHCSAWIVSFLGKSPCIRTKKRKEGEH